MEHCLLIINQYEYQEVKLSLRIILVGIGYIIHISGTIGNYFMGRYHGCTVYLVNGIIYDVCSPFNCRFISNPKILVCARFGSSIISIIIICIYSI